MTQSSKLDIMSLLPEELEAHLAARSLPAFRAKQIFAWLTEGTPFSDMTNLPLALRRELEETCELRLPQPVQKLVSKIDGTVKYLFRLLDGQCIESVLMQYKHGNTLCISSQVGCRMGCRFCASTIGGKARDLLPSELLGQVIAAQKDSGLRISNVVMMGIGEPLDNFDNVVRFLRLVNHPKGLNIGYRHISLSTCGLVPRIADLAALDLPITLSVSLHAATDEQRSAVMPVNRKWNLAALLDACVSYYRVTGRRISFEYTLLAGQNDRPEDAEALIALLRAAFAEVGMGAVHVNLIRVNEVRETGFRRGSAESAAAFAKLLEKGGFTATVRRRLGADVEAACGQLRRSAQVDTPQAD